MLRSSGPEPAVVEILHVLEHHPVLAHEHDPHEVSDDEWRNNDLLPFHMRLERLDPEGDMRIVAHDLWDRRALRLPQELDILWVLARVGHPAAALLDPVFVRLLLG